jgi:hypothetical protein
MVCQLRHGSKQHNNSTGEGKQADNAQFRSSIEREIVRAASAV